ncbi:MAG: DUF4254 domain-containing protein [Pirellulaceae bacterium]
MIDVKQITEMQRECVVRWHGQEVDNAHQGLLGVACTQHGFNFRLWHQEDIARSPEAGDVEIAQVKRAIDGLNQQRNDWIERIDDVISERLTDLGIGPDFGAPLNTETPGSCIDRLSIMSLRLYHLDEQLQRDDVNAEHVERVEQKLAICMLQHEDLAASLSQLLDDIFTGRKRHKTYRQCKMYNDPTLNPQMYRAGQVRKAG